MVQLTTKLAVLHYFVTIWLSCLFVYDIEDHVIGFIWVCKEEDFVVLACVEALLGCIASWATLLLHINYSCDDVFFNKLFIALR